MHPREFLQTLYLGDRACKSLLIDGWNARVVITVDCISRVDPKTGQWDYYTEKDIEDGRIVLTGVQQISLEPQGCFPNDLINDAKIIESAPGDASPANFIFTFLINHIRPGRKLPEGCEMTITIEAAEIHLEDPRRPGLKITDW
jgi:hypothetical protein